MVQWAYCCTQGPLVSQADIGRGTFVQVFHAPQQYQDVPRLEIKLLVDFCQRVRASHLKVASVLQPLPIPSWKWEDISMDFIVGLPNTSQRHDSILVIVDRLTKTAHFLPMHTTYNAKKYAEIYLDQIVRLHGVPKMIISDRGAQFIARFWEQLQHSLGTKLIRSSAYHPQTDGQTERVNQILEDMLRACVIQYDRNWDKCLSLAEFSYNNGYQSSLKMDPFEALYDR
jgi:hypothetical protein